MKLNAKFLLAGFVLLVANCLPSSAQSLNITPLFDCIEYEAGATTMTVHFGYYSREAATVTVPISADNRFVPAPANRGQILVFHPGLHQRAFSLTTSVNGIQWLFHGQGVPALYNPKNFCRQPSNLAPNVVPLLTSVHVNGQTGQATATFGYYSQFGGTVNKGSSNYFSFSNSTASAPFPGDRGQPTQFQAGLVRNAFQVTFDPATEPAVVWNLLGQTIVAVPPPALPTAASLELGGAVRNRAGRGIGQARLTLTNTATLETARAQTNSFGHYRFADLQAGNAYLLEIQHKRHSFSPQIVQLFDTREDFTLMADK